jgi:Lon protease-like protein
LPIFPISTVLLPGSELPFQIFPEKRDLQSMFLGLRDHGLLGVVLADYDVLNGSFARVGCQAEVTDLTELDDGRLIVETVGLRRFRILSIGQWWPHIVAVVEYLEDVAVTDALATKGGLDAAAADYVEQECWRALQALPAPQTHAQTNDYKQRGLHFPLAGSSGDRSFLCVCV